KAVNSESKPITTHIIRLSAINRFKGLPERKPLFHKSPNSDRFMRCLFVPSCLGIRRANIGKNRTRTKMLAHAHSRSLPAHRAPDTPKLEQQKPEQGPADVGEMRDGGTRH